MRHIMLALFAISSFMTVAAQQPTFIHRPYVLSHYTLMETGGGYLLSPVYFPAYYQVWHSSFSQGEGMAKAKSLPRLAVKVSTANQVAQVDSLDSVTVRRAKVLALDHIDKSSEIGSFLSVEKERLQKILSEFGDNVSKIQAPDYGGSSTLFNLWNIRYRSVRDGVRIAESYRMKTVDRKKCYIDLYNDVMKYNKELSEVLTYLMAAQKTGSLGRRSPVQKVDKKAYIDYARSRWKLSCVASKRN